MKSSTGNAIALLVVVALFIGLYVQWNVRSSLSRQLGELQDSVESLRDEVRALQATVGVVGQRLGAFDVPAGKTPDQPAVSTGTAPEMNVEPAVDETPEYNEEPVDIVLQIGADRSLTLDGRAVTMDGLETELRRLMQARPAMHLIVKAAETVATADVTACVDTAGKAGIHNVDIATAADNEQPDGAE
jgi:biopolymer transport protein ExbD